MLAIVAFNGASKTCLTFSYTAAAAVTVYNIFQLMIYFVLLSVFVVVFLVVDITVVNLLCDVVVVGLVVVVTVERFS